VNKVNAQTIGPVSVSKHLKLSQKDSAKIVVGSPSTLSVDSGNTNEQERLAEFDEDSTEGNTTEDDQVDPSSSATSVCSRSVVIMRCSVCLCLSVTAMGSPLWARMVQSIVLVASQAL